jgi:hypothetical protein
VYSVIVDVVFKEGKGAIFGIVGYGMNIFLSVKRSQTNQSTKPIKSSQSKLEKQKKIPQRSPRSKVKETRPPERKEEEEERK